jgi:hypothetical protein
MVSFKIDSNKYLIFISINYKNIVFLIVTFLSEVKYIILLNKYKKNNPINLNNSVNKKKKKKLKILNIDNFIMLS